MTVEKPITRKQRLLAVVRLIRPQFIIAYIIIGISALAFGLFQDYKLLSFGSAFFAFVPIILAAIGVHLRDEAGDWSAGYDLESGGMGVIREGIFAEQAVRNWGRVITLIAIFLGIYQAIEQPLMLLVGIPMFVVIIYANYLTEEVPLGHELVTASSYWGTFLWVYLYQEWPLTLSIILGSFFIYLIVLALIPYQDIADYEVDYKSGKKTLTVRLGLDGVGHLSIFLALFSLLILCLALLV